MRRLVPKRRSDGVVQLRRQPAWRAVAGTVPAAVLGFLLVAIVGLAGLATALVHVPMLVLLVGGLAVLVLSAARFALQGPRPAPRAHPRPRPPRDAA